MTHTSSDISTRPDGEIYTFYVTAPAGLQGFLATEMTTLGATRVQQAGAGVRADGPLRLGYQACLWCRTANRVLLPLADALTPDDTALYNAVGEIDWSLHITENDTLAVDAFLSQSGMTHSHYAALKVKDAIVDQFRDRIGLRPSVDREKPSIRVNVYVHKNRARIALDLSGQSLHRRGYRQAAGPAPLKENLAAALLFAMDWPARAQRGEPLVDPMCGSGTLLLEAAMMAANQAPGLGRDYFGFSGWRQHDAVLWENAVAEARSAITTIPMPLVGYDQSAEAIRQARENAAAAGLQDAIDFEVHALGRNAVPSTPAATGLVLSNPPYGARLELPPGLFKEVGLALSRDYAGWDCGLFVADSTPVGQTGLQLTQTITARNGAIDCTLMSGRIPASSYRGSAKRLAKDAAKDAAMSSAKHAAEDVARNAELRGTGKTQAHDAASTTDMSSAAAVDEPATSSTPTIDTTPLVNRLAKNARSLKSWLKRESIKAYRLYDADIPEFAFAIDVYEAEQRHIVVQEYQPPATVNQAMADARRQAVLAHLPLILGVDTSHMHVKERRRQSGKDQYEKLDVENKGVWVREHRYEVQVNFTDYLDTGLFLDHRKVRGHIASQAVGKRFLNLFAYTATATVAAVSGGASASISVDNSNRYCEWAARNLERNGADLDVHHVVKADVLKWLRAGGDGQVYDVILLDPPTYSNSHSLNEDFDVVRDHAALVEHCLDILAPDGLLIFSCNARKFRLEERVLHNVTTRVEDRSRWSLDPDFHRNPRIHQCWFIQHA